MDEALTKPPIWDRFRWWLYERCFAYCVRMAAPGGNPGDFCLLDMTSHVAVERDEIGEIVAEVPALAWRFEGVVNE